MIRILFSIQIISLLFSQQIENKNICAHSKSLLRSSSFSSTLTDNQNKIDISYYKIEIDIDFDSEVISGAVEILGEVGMIQPDTFEIDLYDNMIVDSVRLFGENISVFYHQNNLIKIPAPETTLPEGYSFNIDIFYHGSPEHCGAAGLKFDMHQNIDHLWTLSEAYCARSWWPSKDDPSDKADSLDIIVTVPNQPDFIVASVGTLQNIEQSQNTKTYHWKEMYPITTYLVSLAIYPYTVWSDQYISPLSGEIMQIDHYVFPDRYATSYSNYLLTSDMLILFSELFGEYPFINEKYGHADFRWGGGMEHQTLSSMGGSSQDLIAHELGHQWWGNLITCKSFHDIWLNEGFARYCQALWAENQGGKEAYHSFMNNHAYYGSGTIYVEEPNSNSDIFLSGLSYNKASWVLHMLRNIVGDNMFFDILKSYASNDSLKYDAASTSDFKEVCEEMSGLDLDSFFNQWIYSEKYPHYQMSWWVESDGIYKVRVDQIQTTGYFDMPIDISFRGGQGQAMRDTTLRINNSSSSEIYEFSNIGFQVDDIILDPDEWILKEITYSIAGLEKIIPENISFAKAYPNPFNARTRVDYVLNSGIGEIATSVKVFNVQGKLIEEILLNKSSPGLNTFFWEPKNITSGVYIFELLTGNQKNILKVLLLK